MGPAYRSRTHPLGVLGGVQVAVAVAAAPTSHTGGCRGHDEPSTSLWGCPDSI